MLSEIYSIICMNVNESISETPLKLIKIPISYRNTADIPPGIYKFTLLSENAQSIET